MLFLLSCKSNNIYSNKNNSSNNPPNLLDLNNNNKNTFYNSSYNLKQSIILEAELIFIKKKSIKIKYNNINIFNLK